MKTNLFLTTAVLMGLWIAGCGTSTVAEHASDTEAPNDWTSYGEAFEIGEPMGLSAAAELLASTGEAEGQFEVEIVETCTKMGCWMSVNGPSGEPVMVYMKDHAFFVPKSGMAGKRAIISGYAYNDTVSVELQKHLLEDAARSQEEIDAVTEVKFELAFSAAGVKIEGVESTTDQPADADDDAHEHEHEDGHEHEHDHEHEGEEHTH